jgi:hypothetical protein
MTAGLPGTGIGGLFYILLCVLMPFFHVFRMFKGDHKPHHLKTALLSILIAAGILLALYGEAKVLVWIVKATSIENETSFGQSVLAAISPSVAALPFIILFTLLTIIQILRLVFHRTKKTV